MHNRILHFMDFKIRGQPFLRSTRPPIIHNVGPVGWSVGWSVRWSVGLSVPLVIPELLKILT